MSDERLGFIQARLDAVTPGPWEIDGFWETEEYQSLDIFPQSNQNPALAHNIKRSQDAEFIANSPTDIAYLLDLARKQQAVIDAVRELAAAWHMRGENDMAYSKEIPDEDVSMALLTEGASMVENARHIRNALEVNP